jgi:hypothetical protein
MEKKFVPQIQVRSDVRSGTSGGWVNGVWYADMSGVCGGTQPPQPSPLPIPPAPNPNPNPNPNQGNTGGWVGGVWYPNMSGVCG